MKREYVDIPVKKDPLFLKGTIYSSPNTPSVAPWIINCPGLLNTRESSFVRFFSEKFAQAGSNVISYDYRAHGETAKQTGRNWLKQLPKIFTDLSETISWLSKKYSDMIREDKIYLFGRSLGGAIILTEGFIDDRVKKIVSCCTRYDYHSVSKIRFPEDVIKKISPMNFLQKNPKNKNRILIAHCKDDRQIPFENLDLIKTHLDLPEENVVIFEKGGHSFRGHREDLYRRAQQFFQS